MKHAYIITAHNNFSVLKKLLEWLDDERNTIYLHLDAKSKDISVKEFTFLKHARIKAIPRIPLYWAGSSIVEAVLALMEASLAEDYDYCHCLTGADVMLKGLDELDAFLERHYGMEFISFIPRHYDFAQYKAQYYHWFVDNPYYVRYKLVRYVNHGLARLQKLLEIKRRKNAFYYAGSAYYSITRSLVQQIVDRKELLLKQYRYTLATDEVFMQTTVMEMNLKDKIWKFEDESRLGLRFIDWSHNTGSHPRVFTKQDYELLIHQPEDVFWARKFDENVDMEIVDMLYHYQSNK